MSDVVSTFRRREECERRGDEGVHVIKGARSGRAQVRTVRGQEAKVRTDGLDHSADFWLSMDGEVVKDDDVARL